MASILRPYRNILNPGSKQVPTGSLKVDWTNSLTRGLLGCWLPGVGYGVDFANKSPTLGPDSGYGPMVVGREGPALKSTLSGQALYANAPTSYTTGWDEFSLYWRGHNFGDTGGGGLGWLIGVTYNNNMPAPAVVAGIDQQGQLGAGAAFGAIWNSGGVGPGTNTFTAAYPSGSFSAGATFKVSTSAGTVLGYQNGVLATNTTTGFGASRPTVSTTPLIVVNGWAVAAPTRVANALCYIACFWNRRLSADEMAQLDRDPYGFLLPSEYEMPVLFPPIVPPTILYGHNIGASFTRKVTTIGY